MRRRGILVCCIMSWYFVVLGFNKRALFFGTVSMEMRRHDNPYLIFCTGEEQQGPGTQC